MKKIILSLVFILVFACSANAERYVKFRSNPIDIQGKTEYNVFYKLCDDDNCSIWKLIPDKRFKSEQEINEWCIKVFEQLEALKLYNNDIRNWRPKPKQQFYL